MNLLKYSFLILFFSMIYCTDKTEKTIIIDFVNLSLKTGIISECMEELDQNSIKELVDQSTVTENYLEFSEPCNGSSVQLACIDVEQKNLFIISNPEKSLSEKNLGLMIFEKKNDDFIAVEKNIFSISESQIQDQINASSDFLQVNQDFNGQIPFGFKLPQKGKDINLIVNPDLADVGHKDIVFGTFTYDNSGFHFKLNVSNEEENELSIVTEFEGSSSDLFDNYSTIKTRIDKLIDKNTDVMLPIEANLPEIVKETDNLYSIMGEIAWGEGVNTTIIFFDISKNKIYLGNKMEGETITFGEDQEIPKELLSYFE